MSIIIPVRGSTSIVEVFNDELPDSPADVIDLLRAELAPLDTWCEFAVAYHCQGKQDQFREILHSVVDAFDVYEMQDIYRREPALFTSGQLRILNLLAASATSSFMKEHLRKDARDAWRQKALEYIGRADDITTSSPVTWLVKALFWIGEYHRDRNASQNARYYADSSLRNGHSCVANLAKAAILFQESKYADALWLYVKALRLDPNTAGASARVGIGFCAYQLGDKPKAVAAFERVLSLDPRNVEALAAMALLQLDFACTQPSALTATDQSKTADTVARSMFARAAELRPTYSIAINHYANHLFWQWQADLQKSGKTISSSAHLCLHTGATNGTSVSARVNLSCLLSKYRLTSTHNEYVPEINNLASRSYHCTAVPEIQAEAYFILGRNSHARGDMEGALPYYTQACRLWPAFALGQFRLAQVRTALGDLVAATEAAETACSLAPEAPEVLQLLGVLHLQQQSIEIASKILQLAVKANKNDPISWLALANTEECISIKQCSKNERGTVEKAIHAYTTALQLQVQEGSYVFYQTLNNLGVLLFEIGDMNSAAIALHAALKIEIPRHVCDSRSDSTVSSVADVERSLLWRWERLEGEASCMAVPSDPPFGQGKEKARLLQAGTSDVSSPGSHDTILNGPIEDSEVIQNAHLFAPESQIETLAAPMCTNLAQLYASFGTLPMASQLARAALKIDPRGVRCLLLLARLHLDVNQRERAQSYIDSAVEIALSRLSQNATGATGKSSHENATDALAVACVLQSKVNNAVKTLYLLRKLCELPGTGAYSHIILGRLHLCGLLEDCGSVGIASRRAHQLKCASDCARSALKMSPSCSVAANNIGLLLLELGQLDDAAIIFERLRESILGSSRVQSCNIAWDTAVNLAHAYSLTGRWTEAAAVYTMCLRMPPMRVAGIPWGMTVIQSKQADINHWLAHARQGSDSSKAGRALAAAIHLRPNEQQFRVSSRD